MGSRTSKLTNEQRRENRQAGCVLVALAFLLLLSGVVASSEYLDAEIVSGRVVELPCAVEELAPGVVEERCRPVVEYEHDGVRKRLQSRYAFERGRIELGGTVEVNLAADPIDVLSDEHHAGWLLASLGGFVVLLGVSRSFFRAKRSMVSKKPLPEGWLPGDPEP